MRLMVSTVIRMARPGKATTQGAARMNLAAVGQHGAPFRHRRLGAKTEKAEARRFENGVGDAKRRLDDERRQAIGQHGHKHQAQRADARDFGRRDIVLATARTAPRRATRRT